MPAQPRLRFDTYEVCPQQRRIWKQGMRLKLHGQPIQILLMLLDRPGDVVTREHIRNRLWPQETFVDFEHSVNTAIKKLRQTLGDSVQTPRYVETLPGVGYRFIAPVEAPAQEAADASSQSVAEVFPMNARPYAGLLYKAIGGTAAVILALVCLAYYFSYPVPEPRATRITEITHSGKVDAWGGLVFDGARLLFLERAGDHWNLMQTSTKGGPAQPFPEPFRNTRVMDISPDGSQLLVASFIERTPDLPLWVMPLQGGPPRRLGNIIAGSANWTPSGKQIVYASGHDLMIAESDGSNPRKFISVSGFPLLPAWSPDGRTMRFTVDTTGADQDEIWEATADGKNPYPLFTKYSQFQTTCCGRWTPDGRYYIFTARKGGLRNLWALQVKSPFWRRRLSGPVELAASPRELWYPMLSRDGRTVFAFTSRPSEDIARIDVATGKTFAAIPNSQASELFFSKDGKWVSYTLGSPRSIWRSRTDGTESLQLTDDSLNGFDPRWSPDGKWIVFASGATDRPARAYLVPSTGGMPKPILPQFDFTGRAEWSPDGKLMVLEARKGPAPFDQPEQHSLYILNLATGEAVELPGSEGFIGPRWSPDGKRLAATNDPNDSVMVYDFEKRQWTKAATGTYLSAVAWSRGSRYIYYQDVLGKDEPLYRIRMSDLSRETIFNFHELLSGNVFRCGFIGLDPSGSPLVTLSLSDSDIYAIDLDLP